MRIRPLPPVAAALAACLLVAVAPAADADVIFFGDALQNGAAFDTNSGVAMTTVSDPTFEGSAAFGAAIPVANQGFKNYGLSVNPQVAIPAGSTTLRFAVYFVGERPTSFMARVDGAQLFFDDTSNAAHWTIDGAPGSIAMSLGEWHVIEIDLAGAFGAALTTDSVFGRFLITSRSNTSAIYLDSVALVPEPASLVLVAAGALSIAVPARRRRVG